MINLFLKPDPKKIKKHLVNFLQDLKLKHKEDIVIIFEQQKNSHDEYTIFVNFRNKERKDVSEPLNIDDLLEQLTDLVPFGLGNNMIPKVKEYILDIQKIYFEDLNTCFIALSKEDNKEVLFVHLNKNNEVINKMKIEELWTSIK